jgi:hypothetical protein
VTPTAQLLAELLPLLTSYCLEKVQQGREQRQQLLAALKEQLQQAVEGAHAAEMQGSNVRDALSADLNSTVQAVDDCVCGGGLGSAVLHLSALLRYAVVPDPNLTAAEVQAADVDRVGYRCTLHAQDLGLQNAGEVVHLCEVLLRDAADFCAAATQMHDDGRVVSTAGASQQVTASGAVAGLADSHLRWSAKVACVLIGHQVPPVAGCLPRYPSALALAALSAGSGSDLQQHLFSLLCTMVKVGRLSAGTSNPTAPDASKPARADLEGAAAFTAAAMLVLQQPVAATAAAPGMQAPHHPADAGDSHAAATSRLPSMLVLGRCCLWWAKQVESVGVSRDTAHVALHGRQNPFMVLEQILPPVQQWLQASSTQAQLAAAGYLQQDVPQQLQQMVSALKAAGDNAGSSQFTASNALGAGQRLQEAGNALCSFAVPCLCNNPSCANLSGLTELGLVSGCSCVCGGCHVARYCGRACQRFAWKQHKPLCAALAAAAAN